MFPDKPCAVTCTWNQGRILGRAKWEPAQGPPHIGVSSVTYNNASW